MTMNDWTPYQFWAYFYLELAPGCSRRDVRIGQELKGEVRLGSSVPIKTSSWVQDNVDLAGKTYPWTHWWDGVVWHAAGPIGLGKAFYGWSWFGSNESAKFLDGPGMQSYATPPFYFGGLDNQGFLEFRTYVEDASGTRLADKTWGIRIDCPTADGACTHDSHR